ncbi:MAG: type II secretion system F family protein [Rhodothermales bacterium]
MKEFRFVGVSATGEPIRGSIYAPTRRSASKRVEVLSDKHRFEPELLEERHTYRYKVRHANGGIAVGEQKAFSHNEVTDALERLGLEVITVRRKVVETRRKPSSTDLVMFVRLAANMLRRKLPFDEILNLLITDTTSKSLRQVIRDLSSDLKGGVDPQQAFMKHQHTLGKFTAYMLGLASSSGNMAEMFEATARYLERKDEFRKSVKSAMITPAITLVATIIAFFWFIWYIIPQMAGLYGDFNITLPPLTRMSLSFAGWMDNNWFWVVLTMVATGLALFGYFRSVKGKLQLHSTCCGYRTSVRCCTN